jgi:thioesterase domain-containing protein
MLDSYIPDATRFDYALSEFDYLQDIQALYQHPLYLQLEELGYGALLSAAQMNHLIRIIKYLRKLEGVHVPAMPIGTVHLFVAEDQLAPGGGDEALSAWQLFGGTDLRTHMVSGNHFTALQKDNVGMFAAKLLDILNATDLRSAQQAQSELAFHEP